MTTNNGWPDPARPGVPLNPERDGWHWLKTPDSEVIPFEWRVEGECERGRWPSYWVRQNEDCWTAEECEYIGPCLIPDEATALQKRVAELEGMLGLADSWITAVIECKEWHWDADQHESATHTRDEIRAALTGGKDVSVAD